MGNELDQLGGLKMSRRSRARSYFQFRPLLAMNPERQSLIVLCAGLIVWRAGSFFESLAHSMLKFTRTQLKSFAWRDPNLAPFPYRLPNNSLYCTPYTTRL